jgi:MYXO-CTERM domain-containing protein
LAKEVARRKVLIARRSDYVLTRLHHRFATLDDIQLEPAAHMKGGVTIPSGEAGELPQEASPSDTSQFQTRIATFHPTKKAFECPAPERYRWGRPPRDFRGARKIWVADRLAWRDRGKVKLDEVVETPIPSLGIQGAKKAAEVATEAAKKAAEAAAKSDCDCRMPGQQARPASGWVAVFVALFAVWGRRRRQRCHR